MRSSILVGILGAALVVVSCGGGGLTAPSSLPAAGSSASRGGGAVGPAEVEPIPEPAPAPPPSPYPLTPVCTTTRPTNPNTLIETSFLAIELRDGARPNPSTAGGFSLTSASMWTLKMEWEIPEPPIQFTLSHQGTNLPTDPVLPLQDARMAQTGPTTWEACWQGEAFERYFVTMAWPAGTRQTVGMTYTYQR